MNVMLEKGVGKFSIGNLYRFFLAALLLLMCSLPGLGMAQNKSYSFENGAGGNASPLVMGRVTVQFPGQNQNEITSSGFKVYIRKSMYNEEQGSERLAVEVDDQGFFLLKDKHGKLFYSIEKIVGSDWRIFVAPLQKRPSPSKSGVVNLGHLHILIHNPQSIEFITSWHDRKVVRDGRGRMEVYRNEASLLHRYFLSNPDYRDWHGAIAGDMQRMVEEKRRITRLASRESSFDEMILKAEKLERNGQTIEALRSYVSALKIKPKSYNVADKIFSVGEKKFPRNYDSLIKRLGLSMERGPAESYLYLQLMSKNKPRQAMVNYLKYLKQHPDDKKIKRQFKRLVKNSKSQDYLPEVIELYFKLYGRNDDMLLVLGKFYEERGRHKEAFKCYSDLARSGDKSADTYVRMGGLLEKLGDFKTAAEIYVEGLNIDKDHWRLRQRLQSIIPKVTDPLVSVLLLKKMIAINGKYHKYHLMLAEQYAAQKLFKDANISWQTALSLKGEKSDVFSSIAKAYIKGNKKQEGASFLWKYIERYPEAIAGSHTDIVELLSGGRYDKRLVSILKKQVYPLKSKEPSRGLVKALTSEYARFGMDSSLHKFYSDLFKKYPQKLEYYTAYLSYLKKQNQKARAQKVYEKVVSLFKKNDYIFADYIDFLIDEKKFSRAEKMLYARADKIEKNYRMRSALRKLTEKLPNSDKLNRLMAKMVAGKTKIALPYCYLSEVKIKEKKYREAEKIANIGLKQVDFDWNLLLTYVQATTLQGSYGKGLQKVLMAIDNGKLTNYYNLDKLAAPFVEGQRKDDVKKILKKFLAKTEKDNDGNWKKEKIADIYLKLGMEREAAGVFLHYLRKYPAAATHTLHYVRFLHKHGNIDEARNLLVKASRLHNLTVKDHARIGKEYLELKDYQHALKWLKKTYAADKTDSSTTHDIIKCYRKLGKKSEAIKYIEEGTRRKASFYSYAGADYQQLLWDTGNNAVARKLTPLLIADSGFLTSYWLKRVVCNQFLHDNQIDKAIRVHRNALGQHPNDKWVIRYAAEFLSRIGQHGSAIDILRQHPGKLEDRDSIISKMADILKTQGKYREALHLLRDAYEKTPKKELAKAILSLQVLMGDKKQALVWAQRVLSFYKNELPYNITLYYRVFAANQAENELADNAKGVLVTGKNDYERRYALRVLEPYFAAKGQFRDIQKSFSLYMRKNQQQYQSFKSMAELFWRHGKFEKSLNTMRKALAKWPKSRKAVHEIAHMLVKLDRYDEAVQLFKKYHDKNDDYGLYLEKIVNYLSKESGNSNAEEQENYQSWACKDAIIFLMGTGKNARALKLLKSCPRGAEELGTRRLAWLYAITGDTEKAARLFEDGLHRQNSVSQISFGYVENLALLEKYEKARRWLDLYLKLHPTSNQASLLSADIEMKIGSKQKAIQLAQKVKQRIERVVSAIGFDKNSAAKYVRAAALLGEEREGMARVARAGWPTSKAICDRVENLAAYYRQTKNYRGLTSLYQGSATPFRCSLAAGYYANVKGSPYPVARNRRTACKKAIAFYPLSTDRMRSSCK